MCSLVNSYLFSSGIKMLVNKMYYTQRLKWVRDCKNVTQKEIADYLLGLTDGMNPCPKEK